MSQPGSDSSRGVSKRLRAVRSSGSHRRVRRVRSAYFNTTRGVLTGRTDDDDVRQIRQELSEHHIAYLFNADATRPRPMFSSYDWDSIGLEEIRDHISEISEKAV